MRVDKDDLEIAGRLLAGDNWQRALARMLAPYAPPRLNATGRGVDDSLLRKWKRGERNIPEWVGPALAALLRKRAKDAEAFAKRIDLST
ncbi:MAG: hypothetical protein KGL46_10000 [Hyphomicrobiales bacterium]|nr:hypothetical protein [Hyphomicrobiales bacterium]